MKHDPLIFGTVNIGSQNKTCDGIMYLVTQDNRTLDVILPCSTCSAVKKLSFLSYHLPEAHICGATICQE